MPSTAPLIVTLPNAVRLVAWPAPALATATVAVFVRTGSAHEARLVNGISHVVEHMVFKGTPTRDARRINVEAEHRGADANAHTDKDHTAYYLRGLPEHVGEFVDLLADLTLRPTFPADELERERQVLLQELAEDADDAVSTGYKLFDAACFGLHAAAQPVVGTPRHLERLQRADLEAYVQRQYTGANLVVGAAGAIDAEAFLRRAETAFAPLVAGRPNVVPLAVYEGGVRTRAQDGSSQTHLLLGGGLPARRAGDGSHTEAGALAAAVLGEGMSSPLLHELRERRALAYHAACAADVLDMCGQFVIEASTAPERAGECIEALLKLLAQHAEHLDPQELARARRQLTVRRLRNADKPLRRLEDAALDLFAHGRVRGLEERLAALATTDSGAVRSVFERLIADGLSLAVTGEVRRGTGARARERLAALARG